MLAVSGHEFIVETKGRCFLCWNQSHSAASPGLANPISKNTITHSLQYLSNYLGLDLTKAFLLGRESIQSHLVTKVERSRLKVELCDGCICLTDKFSEMYRQLEMVEMKVSDCLNLIHGKLKLTDQGVQEDRDEQIVTMGEDDFGGKLQVAEVLRSEALQKCSSKLRHLSPRIKIRKLSMNKFKRETAQINSLSPRSLSDEDANIDCDYSYDLQTPLAELEYEDNEIIIQNQSITPHSFSEEPYRVAKLSDLEEETPTPITVNPTCSKSSPSATKSKYKYTINVHTGRYKCGLCPREYENDGSFHYHYNAVHRQVRYQCPLPECDKSFANVTGYRRHHQTEHTGVRHSCPNCSKVFRQSDQLRIHRKNTHAEEGFECRYCSQLFPTVMDRNMHVKLYCPLNVDNSVDMTTIGMSSSARDDSSNTFQCYICHRKFGSRRERTRHYQNHPCPQCGKRFKRITSVRDHIQAVHLGIRFQCGSPGCGKLCPDRSALNKHKKICKLKAKKGVKSMTEEPKDSELVKMEGIEHLPSELINDAVEGSSNNYYVDSGD